MSQHDALALLDLEGSERFASPVPLLSAVDLPWDLVVEALHDDSTFVRAVAGGAGMSLREIGRLRVWWRMQQGLVADDDLRRLLWILSTFSRDVEADLLHHCGVRLSDLWQRREWRLLLNLIDHLPRTTWTQSAMANHPEYANNVAEAVARSRVAGGGNEDAGGSLTEWTPEVQTLAALIDAVNALRTTFIAANMAAGKQPPQIPPYPRPRTLVDSMVDKKERALRWSTHESLAAKLLPNK